MLAKRVRSPLRDKTPVLVALEVVLLWPRGVREPAATIEEASLWPVFVIVVADRQEDDSEQVRPLFELMDQPRPEGQLTVVGARCRWSVLDPRNALLRLAVRGDAPVRFAMEVLVPARRVLGVLDVVARGATIGITTVGRAGRLSSRGVDIRKALDEVVLLSSPPSDELDSITDSVAHEVELTGE